MATDDGVGRNVKALREAQGLSQAQLALAVNDVGDAGWFPQTVTKLEAGTRSLKFSEGMLLAQVLNVPPDRLWQDPEGPDDQHARTAIAVLRKANQELMAGMRQLLEAEAELTWATEQLALSPGVAEQAQAALASYGAEQGLSNRLARVAAQAAHDLEHIVESGPEPDDDALADMAAQRQLDWERGK